MTFLEISVDEHISFIASSRLAAVSVGVAVVGVAAMAWFLLRAFMTALRKAAVALRALMRLFRLWGQRIKNFPGTAFSAFFDEVSDAKRFFFIESAHITSFWKRVGQAVLFSLLVVAGALGYTTAYGLRDSYPAAHDELVSLGALRLAGEGMVWDSPDGARAFALLPGEHHLVVEGEELRFPSWLHRLGLKRHHRVLRFRLYREPPSTVNPGVPDRSITFEDAPFFTFCARHQNRLPLKRVTFISPPANLAAGEHSFSVLPMGYAIMPVDWDAAEISYGP
ncbi:MAG: hypothetical protein JSV08_04180 [Acidobacteriota bacterium]|nr:MAG: hypothetical protein JSV08_04180 [Acidobacteriota bacterium]